MKTVLVLGGTGAIGRYLVPELAGLGYAVTAVGIEENPPKDYVPRDSERGLRMDAYIKEHNL